MFEMVPWRKNNNTIQRRGDLFEDMFKGFFNDDFLMPFGSLGGKLSVDLKETENEYIVEADLPGIDKKDINISYNNSYLTIAAKREAVTEDKQDNYLRQERSYGEFRRCFYIDNIDDQNIQANFDNGVLKITHPKVAKEKETGRQIDIN